MNTIDAPLARPAAGKPSFSLANRIRRLTWQIVYWSAFRLTPTPMAGWRNMILRLFGARIAATARISPSVRIWWPGHLTMEDQATLGPATDCYNMAHITIGARAVISQKAVLCAGSHDISDPSFQLIARPIRIGADSWVASEAFVGPGGVVGDRAVLGARAVLFGQAEADGVYAGNPARLIKTRVIRDGG